MIFNNLNLIKVTFVLVILSLNLPSFTFAQQHGDLIRAQGDTKIYFIQNGQRRAIANEEVFRQMGFKMEDVKELDSQTVMNIPEGPPLWSKEIISPYPDGTLIRLQGKVQTYVISGGRKCYIPDPETFHAWGFKWDQVIEVDQSTFNKIPTGIPLASVKPPYQYGAPPMVPPGGTPYPYPPGSYPPGTYPPTTYPPGTGTYPPSTYPPSGSPQPYPYPPPPGQQPPSYPPPTAPPSYPPPTYPPTQPPPQPPPKNPSSSFFPPGPYIFPEVPLLVESDFEGTTKRSNLPFVIIDHGTVKSCHSRENGNPENSNFLKFWIHACSGMKRIFFSNFL